MLKRSLECYAEYEKDYPGFIEIVVNFENAILPTCPMCGSWHTAQVSPGIVSQSIHLLSATTKFKLNPNKPGSFYCNECDKYFTPMEWDENIWWHELINVDNCE